MNKKQRWVSDHPILFALGFTWCAIMIATLLPVVVYTAITLGAMI